MITVTFHFHQIGHRSVSRFVEVENMLDPRLPDLIMKARDWVEQKSETRRVKVRTSDQRKSGPDYSLNSFKYRVERAKQPLAPV